MLYLNYSNLIRTIISNMFLGVLRHSIPYDFIESPLPSINHQQYPPQSIDNL